MAREKRPALEEMMKAWPPDKKLGRGGKDRPPGIILRRDRNMVPAEKIPEPWPPITSGPSPPTLQRPSQRVTRRT